MILLLHQIILHKIFNKILNRRASEFVGIKDRIDHNKLIYNFKTEEESPKDCKNYELLLELFKNLRNGETNPKKVLGNQVKFKSDLAKIKIGINKSEGQKNTMKNIIDFLKFTRKGY